MSEWKDFLEDISCRLTENQMHIFDLVDKIRDQQVKEVLTHKLIEEFTGVKII